MIAWIKYAWNEWGPARCLMTLGFGPIWLLFIVEFLYIDFVAGLTFLCFSIGIAGVYLWFHE